MKDREIFKKGTEVIILDGIFKDIKEQGVISDYKKDYNKEQYSILFKDGNNIWVDVDKIKPVRQYVKDLQIENLFENTYIDVHVLFDNIENMNYIIFNNEDIKNGCYINQLDDEKILYLYYTYRERVYQNYRRQLCSYNK